MLLDKLIEDNKQCTGCGACDNVCPVDAIKMLPDEKGFFYPHIDDDVCISCKRCEKVCPQLNLNKNNIAEPDCYAARASDDIVMKSASGGVFSILAKFVFDRDGFVCGAAYDDDYKGVSHIMISTADDMALLRGSKYVYSKPGHIYKHVKDKLDLGSWVLFSGTPCQVAALNNYLGSEQARLITVDILCGGVPSEKVFRAYIEEISEGRTPVSVSFRPKEFGWHYSGIKTVFDNNSTHMVHSLRDPYLKGFMNWLFVGDACADCHYAPPARQGDFSIGDFWNIDKFDESLFFEDGISCLLVNNEKAKEILGNVKDDIALKRKVPVSFLKRFNRLQSLRRGHLARERFFNLLERGFSFKKAVDYSLGWKFDIALTGCWTVKNYGGELSYFALYKTLNDMGYTVMMTERRKDLPNYDLPSLALFIKKPYPFYDVSRIMKSFKEQQELNIRVKNFILGSDQVWNYRLMGEDSIDSYSLDYVAEYRKKIAYGASFGANKFIGSDAQREKFKKNIIRFDKVSVREEPSSDILKNEFDVSSQVVLDPVFLCDIRHYYDLIKNANTCIQGNYIFTYFLFPDNYKIGSEMVAKKLKFGLRNTVNADQNMAGFSEDNWPYSYESNCKLENWLFLLMNSSFVITDSFHATCMSIIFKKPFFLIKGGFTNDFGLGRITSLLKRFDLEDRLVNKVTDILEGDMIYNEIDYESVHERLNKDRELSRCWLSDAIESDFFDEQKGD